MLRPILALCALVALGAAAGEDDRAGPDGANLAVDDGLEHLQRPWSALEPDRQFKKLIRRFEPSSSDVVTIGIKLVFH